MGQIHAISSKNLATEAEKTLLDCPATERKTDTRETERPIVSKNDAKAIPMLSPKLSSTQMLTANSKKIRAGNEFGDDGEETEGGHESSGAVSAAGRSIVVKEYGLLHRV
ncbi:hypothetical protein EIP86_002533 [Pleurotus ostreatoroseus]|nr:hypothetical protein EIP86_002533 [Pleurotus ostreatoroseus]